MHQSSLPQLLCTLAELTPESAERLAAFFRPVTYTKHEFLIRENTIADAYSILASGFFRSWTQNTDGDEVTTAFYSPGQVVVEPWSFFRRVPSGENIQALTDSTGWTINFAEVQTAFHASPEFREFGRRLLIGAYARLKARMLAAIHQTAEERYRNLLTAEPDIFQHAQLKQVASYLGITDTSLSRIRKEVVRSNP